MTIINEIIAISQDISLLHTAREPVKQLIHFALGDHQLDLPTAALDHELLGEIPINPNPRQDILAVESHALERVFVAGHIPNLDRVKRIKILRQILGCCDARERNLLLGIITTRSIPGINRHDVLKTYGNGWLDAHPIPPAPSQPVAPVKPKTNAKIYEPFSPLKSLGYQF